MNELSAVQKFFAFLLILTTIFALYLMSAYSAESAEGVAPERVERLSKGINIPRWLWLGPEPAPALTERVSHQDLDLIQAVGFKHVRIPIQWKTIYDAQEPDKLNQRSLKLLDQGIEVFIKRKLGVIIDLHHIKLEGESSNYSGPIEHDPEFVKTFIDFWSSFAKHLSQFDPDYVFIEPMNEPTFVGHTEDWVPIQNRLVSAIRKNAPQHTILATCAHWSNLHTFVKLKPLDDPNIVYNFHFYEPFPLTHQGASWTSEHVRPMREVPYPSSPQLLEKAVKLVDNQKSKDTLIDYGKQRWNAEKINEEISIAAQWAKKYNAVVTCNEFGAYRNFAPRQSLLAWHRDLIDAFEKHGVGWCKWELDGGFGFFNKEDGRLILDEELTKAMQLNAAAGK
ncbi:MAG: cellulase family glycosylhydrolase [Candidatus Hinthialibacter antarcticus]|nr:cellulase family glycosylhydrolase [Candidatus Hinthialibacter antarcticus]